MASSPELQKPDNLREFHFFPKLPAEIQLLVWDFWRLSHSPLRHYFLLQSDGRLYAALDLWDKDLVETTAKSSNPKDECPLDPMEYKIHLTNRVAPIIHQEVIRRFFEGKPSVCFRPASKHTWVNFQKDVFFFHSTYKYPGRFRFLYKNIRAKSPTDIEQNHWATKIQQLAVLINSRSDHLEDLDRRTFSRFKYLRVVFLVVKVTGPCRTAAGRRNRLTHQGFANLEVALRECRRIDPNYRANINWCKPALYADAARSLRGQLKKILAENGQTGVKIEIVADLHGID